jgi:hypothetical protein
MSIISGVILLGLVINVIFMAIFIAGFALGIGASAMISLLSKLFLWLTSAGIVWWAAQKSQRQPENSLVLLRSTAIHWAEHSQLALPGLEALIRQAYTQNHEETQQELLWVIAKRPGQAKIARQILLENLAVELQQRHTLDEIASAKEHLTPLLPNTENTLKELVENLLRHLYELTTQAQQARDSDNDQEARYELLNPTKERLQKTLPELSYQRRDKLDDLLISVADSWLETLALELAVLNETKSSEREN